MAQAIKIKMMDREVELDLLDNTITKYSIKSAFMLSDNSILSLWYCVGNRQIWCQVNETGTTFLLPVNWANIQFFADSKTLSRPATPVDQVMNVNMLSPYYHAMPPDPAPLAESFIEWMFYVYDEIAGKSTTICIHPRFFVTFRHGTHLNFKIGDELTIYNANKEVNEQTGFKVSVARIHDALDFVLLKSKSDVVKRGPLISEARESEHFTLAGFGNEYGNLTFLPGSIHSVRNHYFDAATANMGPFILGTSRSSNGDSGAGIWGSRGLIGMNTGCTSMPLKSHDRAISEAAVFSAKNIITPAFHFNSAYMDEIVKERKEEKVTSPPQKKSHYVAEFEGIGILYGD